MIKKCPNCQKETVHNKAKKVTPSGERCAVCGLPKKPMKAVFGLGKCRNSEQKLATVSVKDGYGNSNTFVFHREGKVVSKGKRTDKGIAWETSVEFETVGAAKRNMVSI